MEVLKDSGARTGQYKCGDVGQRKTRWGHFENLTYSEKDNGVLICATAKNWKHNATRSAKFIVRYD